MMSEMGEKILLVDDDPQGLLSARRILELAGYQVTAVSDGQAALELLRPEGEGAEEFSVLISDIRMPRLGGLDLFRTLLVCRKELPVILMTAYGQVDDAVWAMKEGAVDFLSKPFKRKDLLTAVDNAISRSLARGIAAKNSPSETDVSSLEGHSPAIVQLRKWVDAVAQTDASVLLTGESGTGKERVAKRIHALSKRSGGPFVALNCAALPAHLIESELFGHEKGAFTGADVSKVGLFETAHGGTLLLDEIGDMPMELQVKLLRVLQEGEIRPVGGNRSKKVDVRVLSATHQDLRRKVSQGSFREDLLYRLEVVTLSVPSLRERTGDLPVLAQSLLAEAARRHERPAQGISSGAMKLLEAHQWPGNIRELSNVLERAVVFADGPFVEPIHLPSHFSGQGEGPQAIPVPVGKPLREVEDLLIAETLKATDGDKELAARLLGVNSRTIYRRLKEKSGL